MKGGDGGGGGAACAGECVGGERFLAGKSVVKKGVCHGVCVVEGISRITGAWCESWGDILGYHILNFASLVVTVTVTQYRGALS